MNTKDAMITRRTWGVFLAFLAFSAIALPVWAQTSEWNSMSAAGDWWNWDPPNSNMQLISNDTWQATFFIPARALNRYKFVANSSWSFPSWGESNQTVFVSPLEGYAEKVTGSGHDIIHSNLVSGFYKVTFNDQTGWYRIELAQAMEANYGFMAVAGDYNGWNITPNMTLISNYTWQTEIYVTPIVTNRFKFVAHNTWGLNWGENNQSIFYSPVTGTAEQNGGDICVYATSNGIYRLTFNDSSRWYKIEFVRPGVAAYPSMAVASSFNGWNPFPNMTLITDHIWQATYTFNNQGISWFKFAANAGWNNQWGDTNQTLFDIPAMAMGDSVSGSGSDIKLFGPLDGTYYFRFNDTNFYYEVVPEGLLQTFNTWTRKNSYGFYTNDGWVVADGRIYDNTDKPRYGLAVNLKMTNDLGEPSGQYFRTPFMTNGVMKFSFWYKSWDSSPAISFEVQKSYDGTSWTTIHTVTNFNSITYQQYSTNDFNETNSVYLRVLHTGGKERLLIDDFHMLESVARLKLSGVTYSPPYPWSNDAVSVSASVIPNTVATDIVARTYYRVGTNGPYTAITMTGVTNWLTTTSAIPAKPSGSVVYYYVGVTFGGRGANSPVYWPDGGSNNPAWYGIPRNKRGAVWVNEVNYEPYVYFDAEWNPYYPDNTNEFVELCGPAWSDIGSWTIELLDMYAPYASYRIPNNTLIGSNLNGFGFFVLGDSNVPNVDMVLTNVVSGDSSLMKRGSIRVRNEFGVIEYWLSYGDPAPTNIPDATYIGWDHYYSTNDVSLGLSGTGSNFINFAWTTNDFATPANVNTGQYLVGGSVAPEPILTDVEVIDCLIRGFVTMYATSTNGWNPAPYYSMRLTNQWSQWIPITPYYSTYANGISTVWFDYPAGVTGAFFRLRTTRSW